MRISNSAFQPAFFNVAGHTGQLIGRWYKVLQKKEAGIFQQYTATASLVSPYVLRFELIWKKKIGSK